MLYKIAFSFFGASIFLFLFWRRLKEDYLSSQIFTASFYILAGLTAANLVSKNFFPLWWFWAAFLGMTLGLLLGILRFRFRVFEAVEASVAGLLPWLGLVFLFDFINSSSLTSAIGVFTILALIVLFYFFDTHYKSFAWYKSGRVGFSGLTVAGIFFLIRAVVALTFTNVLSFTGEKEAILSGIVAFISFLAVFNLARQET